MRVLSPVGTFPLRFTGARMGAKGPCSIPRWARGAPRFGSTATTYRYSPRLAAPSPACSCSEEPVRVEEGGTDTVHRPFPRICWPKRACAGSARATRESPARR